MQAWSAGDTCTWPQCASRSFQTESLFKRHMNYVHINPLLCLFPNCPHKKPFERPSDLTRHGQSVHSSERQFACPIDSCDAQIKEFARKDHLTKHMRERHDNYFCPWNHCFHNTKNSFAEPEDLIKHIKNVHGPYECALMACAQVQLSSKFSKLSLIKHLRNHHGMERGSAHSTYQAHSRQTYTITEWDGHCGECKICDAKRGPK